MKINFAQCITAKLSVSLPMKINFPPLRFGKIKVGKPNAKLPTVMGRFIKRQPNGKRQTREPPKEIFDSS